MNNIFKAIRERRPAQKAFFICSNRKFSEYVVDIKLVKASQPLCFGQSHFVLLRNGFVGGSACCRGVVFQVPYLKLGKTQATVMVQVRVLKGLDRSSLRKLLCTDPGRVRSTRLRLVQDFEHGSEVGYHLWQRYIPVVVIVEQVKRCFHFVLM